MRLWGNNRGRGKVGQAGVQVSDGSWAGAWKKRWGQGLVGKEKNNGGRKGW